MSIKNYLPAGIAGVSILIIVSVIAIVVDNDISKVQEPHASNLASATKPTVNINNNSINNKDTDIAKKVENSQPIIDAVNMPKWSNDAQNIMENNQLSDTTKKAKLMQLLNENTQNIDAKLSLLQTLGMLNPTEYIKEIIPYTKDSDPRVQAVSIGALNNAMFMTDGEENVKQSNESLDKLRTQIAPAVNAVYYNNDTSNDVKEAILSSYATTNGDKADTEKMVNHLLEQNLTELSPNALVYLGNIALDTTHSSPELLLKYNELSPNTRSAIATNIAYNIEAEPQSISILSQKQRSQLADFVQNNPPIDYDGNGAHKLDIWKSTITALKL